MPYALSCGDVMPGCDATFEADSEQEPISPKSRTPCSKSPQQSRRSQLATDPRAVSRAP